MKQPALAQALEPPPRVPETVRRLLEHQEPQLLPRAAQVLVQGQERRQAQLLVQLEEQRPAVFSFLLRPSGGHRPVWPNQASSGCCASEDSELSCR